MKYCLEKDAVIGSSPLLIGVADENIPLVNDEIAKLGSLFENARILTNDSATQKAFAENSRISSFLHIATHAVFRQDNPMFSSLKLADGWLTAFDLFSIALL